MLTVFSRCVHEKHVANVLRRM